MYFCFHTVSQSKLPQILEATNVIIRYILNRFEGSPNSPLLLLSALKSICDGKANYDNVVLHSSLKYLKYPEHSKSNGSGSEKDSPKSEIKRSRSDLSIVILQQLTQPLSHGNFSFATLSEEETDCTVSHLFHKPIYIL